MSPPVDPSSFYSFLQSCAVDGSSAAKSEKEELCVFLCDFLFDVTRRDRYDCWDADLNERAGAAIFRCHLTEKDKYENVHESDSHSAIDVRGIPARQVIDSFQHHLYYHCHRSAYKPYPCYLNVIVGCQKHGIGQGKVRNEIVSWLEKRNTIVWEEKNEHSVISIRLDGWKDFDFFDLVNSSDSDYYGSGFTTAIRDFLKNDFGFLE